MSQHMPIEAHDGDRDIEERLRAMPRRVMSQARRSEIINLLRDAEPMRADQTAEMPWWRRPVPLWRAVAASIAMAGASVAVALGIARNNVPPLQSPTAGFAVNEAAAPAAIVFVEHEWPRRNEQYLGHANSRGWRFIPVEHGENLQ